MENYKEKYENLMKNIEHFHESVNQEWKRIIESYIPEIKESEDERIKRCIGMCITDATKQRFEDFNTTPKECLAWLEKQGEQNPEINDNILLRFAFYQYDDDTLYLSSVFVEECNRKRGYGAKILKAAEEVAKTFGISKIRLKVETNSWMEEWYKRNGYEYLTSEGKYDWLEKHGEQKPQVNSALEVWKDMRLEVYQQASGNRHEPNYSDDRTKMFSLTDIDEIFEKVAEKQNVTDIISDLENYFATTTKEQQEKDWEEIKKWEEKHFNHDRHIEINLTNKIEPKFKVGDTIVEKDLDEYDYETIKDIKDGRYIFTDGYSMNIDEQEGWQLVKTPTTIEQKTADKVEPRVDMVQWKGDNLREVLEFTGKNKNFDKWFTSFEEYEKYVHEHNDIFKLFNEDGSHYEVPVGAWIVKTPDGYNVPSKAKYESKSAWGEEDENVLNLIIQDYEAASKSFCGHQGKLNWLKSLKERII